MEAGIEYREIAGFPGYRVGSDGSVWSCWASRRGQTDKWHRLRPRRSAARRPPRKGKYLSVALWRTGEKQKNMLIHLLVLNAFLGPAPAGMEASHEDGDPANNALGNLRWKTHRANIADKKRHGTEMLGSQKTQAKLTEADVPEIRLMRRLGWTLPEIAAAKKVGTTTIRRVLGGHTWKHVV
jgi:hypothetical protein